MCSSDLGSVHEVTLSLEPINRAQFNGISKMATKVVVFQVRINTPTYYYALSVISQSQTRVKLNRVFLPR